MAATTPQSNGRQQAAETLAKNRAAVQRARERTADLAENAPRRSKSLRRAVARLRTAGYLR
jgi:hypothetical protein